MKDIVFEGRRGRKNKCKSSSHRHLAKILVMQKTVCLFMLIQFYNHHFATVHVHAITKRKLNVHPPGFTSLIHSELERSLQTPIQSTTVSSNNTSDHHDRSRRAQERNKVQPIRINFITSPLEETIEKSNNPKTKLRGEAILNKVLPQLASNFASSLSVLETATLKVPKDACFGYFSNYMTDTMHEPGIKGKDLVIFISAYNDLGDLQLCNTDPKLSTLAVSSPCNVDANDRPVIGFANICLNALDVSIDNTIDEGSLLVLEDVLTHEFIHILGLNSALFKYYRSAFDNTPLTPRRNSIFAPNIMFDTQEVPCVNGKSSQIMEVINDNTVAYNTESIKTTRGVYEERGYYEIVLPTVTQVVRNQFNCKSLQGARLENQPTSDTDCMGSHFDERFFFSDIMSALYDDDAAYFSPLTLALLEDTGWYKSNFTRAKNSPFGINMGCDFVNKDCIENGKVPSHSKGFFCNNIQNKVEKCGPSHHYRGECDLALAESPGRDYFGSTVGPKFTHADFCPLIRSEVTDCDNMNGYKSDPIEVFDAKSRCLNVNLGSGSAGIRTAICIRADCDADTKTFVFDVGQKRYYCGIKDQGKEKEVKHNDRVYRFVCPKLAQTCPDFSCPAMCSGKGVCEWNQGMGVCNCFDPTDDTPGCVNSPVNKPRDPSLGIKEATMSLLAFIIVVFTIVLI